MNKHLVWKLFAKALDSHDRVISSTLKLCPVVSGNATLVLNTASGTGYMLVVDLKYRSGNAIMTTSIDGVVSTHSLTEPSDVGGVISTLINQYDAYCIDMDNAKRVIMRVLLKITQAINKGNKDNTVEGHVIVNREGYDGLLLTSGASRLTISSTYQSNRVELTLNKSLIIIYTEDRLDYIVGVLYHAIQDVVRADRLHHANTDKIGDAIGLLEDYLNFGN